MKIAIMSTYHQQCGFSEYTEQMRFSFERNGHQIQILGNYPYEKLMDEDDDKVFRCFHMEIHDHKNDWDIEGIIQRIKEFDILLIQYESCLYPSSTFNQALEQIKQRTKCQVVMIFHCSGIWPSFPWNLIDFAIAHEGGILPSIPIKSKLVVSHGLVDYPDQDSKKLKAQFGLQQDTFTVGSFGMGRVRYETTIPAVVRAGFQYLISSTERENSRINEILGKLTPEERSAVFYYLNYAPTEELIRRIQACDCILIDYPPISVAVCSGTARIAIGAHRPIIVSQTNWFNDLWKFGFVGSIPADTSVENMIKWLGMAPQFVSDLMRNSIQETYIKEHSIDNMTENKFIPIFKAVI